MCAPHTIDTISTCEITVAEAESGLFSYSQLSLCDLSLRAKIIAGFIGGNRVRSVLSSVLEVADFLGKLDVRAKIRKLAFYLIH